jgi:hypothetical protein
MPTTTGAIIIGDIATTITIGTTIMGTIATTEV